MIKSKIAILFYLLTITCFSCSDGIYFVSAPDYTEEECKHIEANFDKLKIGMNKTEVISLIGRESLDKVLLDPEFFPEQKTMWEVWRLCIDPKSCTFVESLGREQCSQWYMIAFNFETNKLIKVFSEEAEKVLFT